MSESRISVSINDPSAVFTLIEELSKRENDLLREMLADAYCRWLGFASENVLDRLEGFTPSERTSLKVVTENEILPARLDEVLKLAYCAPGGGFDFLKPKKEVPPK